jgi:hypothetical protein
MFLARLRPRATRTNLLRLVVTTDHENYELNDSKCIISSDENIVKRSGGVNARVWTKFALGVDVILLNYYN